MCFEVNFHMGNGNILMMYICMKIHSLLSTIRHVDIRALHRNVWFDAA